ncbi:flagellar motor protein MotB [Methylocaldum sp.]|uniref:flagellar motor protein MotB n=1 Tax=Methylocaldum sp. TaxID=1969727 RepID=UPI002D52CFF2|nr:flagellar motor protein MotB [Methylocaldum sp.]HYE36365.1 flagellar motor protein MotB [Methylocaldum sp.]
MPLNDAPATTRSRRPDTGREAVIDPWQAAAAERTTEQGGWLLNYLDVMTLLFTFFVMLFAYQKAITAESKIAQAPTLVKPMVATAPIPISPAIMKESKPVSANETSASPPVQKIADRAPKAKAEIKVQPAYPVQMRVVSEANASLGKSEAEEADVEASPSAQKAGETPALAERSGKSFPPVSEKGWISEVGDTTVSPAASLGEAFSDAEFSGSVEVSAGSGEVRLEINDAILFDPASADLKPEGSDLLNRLAGVLGTQGGTIAVEGHTDDRPIATPRYRSNWDLSTARASTVTRYLIAHGVSPERLRAVGLADTQPREANGTPEGRARNRRVSIVMFLARKGGVKT